MEDRELKDVILLKAEKEALRIKQETQEELKKRKKQQKEEIKEEMSKYKKDQEKRIDKKIEEEYYMRIHELRRKFTLNKKEYLEKAVEDVFSSIPKLKEKEKERIYQKMKEVVDKSELESPEIIFPKSDEKIIKKIFKGYKVVPSKEIEFGIIAQKDRESIDLSLKNIGDVIKDKIREMLV